jgi:hypothetical protein
VGSPPWGRGHISQPSSVLRMCYCCCYCYCYSYMAYQMIQTAFALGAYLVLHYACGGDNSSI